MPSPLKRPSPGRFGRLLSSLRPPARAGPLLVQTGFPTSLADLVVKNHVRLKKPKKRRTSAMPSSPTPPIAASEPPPQTSPELSPVRDAARPKGAAFSLRPELLALGGALALVLLVIWSKRMVAAFTVASLSLLWIETASRRRPQRPWPAEAKELLDLCGRDRLSPIREVESETNAPKLSWADSDKGSEVSSLCTAERRELGGDDPTSPKRKEKRSLRKLIAKRLHNGKKPKEKDSSGEQPDAGEVGGDAGPVKIEALVASTEQAPSETNREEQKQEGDELRGSTFPFAAFIPVILVGLVAGKLPATALTVLCVAFSSREINS